MGGYGSGLKDNSKQTTEASRRLDIRWLRQQGYLMPGKWTTVSWNIRGRETGKISIEVGISQITLDYTVTDRDEGSKRDYHYPVYLTYTPCNYGGRRPWFTCPLCGKRVAVLYFRESMFYCRTCQNLTYTSCQESGSYLNQLSAQIVRLKRRLGDKNAGGLTDIPDRPKGMQEKTYRRIVTQIYRLEAGLGAAFAQRFKMEL